MSDSSPIAALLFDLGNVLWRIDIAAACDHWARCAGIPAEEISARFAMDAMGERHECGQLSDDAYFEHLCATLGVRIPFADFLAGWNAILCEETPGIADLLARLAPRYPLYAFSNTNEWHRAAWPKRYGHLLAFFRRVFCSHQIGLRKPDPRAFLHVCREIAMEPARVLFFDDTPANVAAARQAGLHAARVTSCAEIIEALCEHGTEEY